MLFLCICFFYFTYFYINNTLRYYLLYVILRYYYVFLSASRSHTQVAIWHNVELARVFFIRV